MSEQWNEKILNYEVIPPPGAWKNITSELTDSNELLPLSRKLYEFEVNPPDGAWNNIAASLEPEKKEVPTLIVKKVNFGLKKLMAAAVFGAVVFGSLYLYNNGLKKKQLSETRNTLSDNKYYETPEASGPKATDTYQEKRPVPQLAASSSSLLNINKEKKRDAPPDNRMLRNAIIKNAGTLGSGLGVMIRAKPIRNEKGYIIQNPELLSRSGDKYINITGPNGQQTRISIKFLHALMYINSDTGIEKFEGFFDKPFIESLVWKSRFEEWRKKIIQTSFIPSSTNFLDILELKDLILKEKDTP